MAVTKTFLDLFNDPSPALTVKFSNTPDEKPTKILVKNSLGSSIGWFGKRYFRTLPQDARLYEFFEFYNAHNGLELCEPVHPDNCQKTPLLQLIPAQHIRDFTKQYTGNGKWAWIIDLNKSKSIYRGGDTWIAFAIVNKGPSCLTIFLTGENAGSVYLAAPEPSFDILKPIAKTFDIFLDRVAKDPAAFLRLIRAYVTMKGADGQHYGFIPVEYSDNADTKEST